MLVRLLGALDLACTAAMGAFALGYPLPQVQAVLALLLGIKGFAFASSFASRIDIVCALGMLALLWFPSVGIALAIGAYLGIKAGMSFA